MVNEGDPSKNVEMCSWLIAEVTRSVVVHHVISISHFLNMSFYFVLFWLHQKHMFRFSNLWHGIHYFPHPFISKTVKIDHAFTWQPWKVCICHRKHLKLVKCLLCESQDFIRMSVMGRHSFCFPSSPLTKAHTFQWSHPLQSKILQGRSFCLVLFSDRWTLNGSSYVCWMNLWPRDENALESRL